MRINEQWGNGLKLISDELKEYPDIQFRWTQPGMSFRATFLRTNYEEEQKAEGKKLDSADDNLTSRPITTDYDRLRTIMNDCLLNSKKYYCMC